MQQAISFRLSAKWMIFGPSVAHALVFLCFVALAVLPAALILGDAREYSFTLFFDQAGSNTVRILIIALVTGFVIDIVFLLKYWKHRDAFLSLTPDAVIVFGLAIPWKYVEIRSSGRVLFVHVTDQSVVDLGRIPWPYSAARGFGYRMIHYPRGEIRLPDWMFEVPLEQVLHAFESSRPSTAPERIAEQAQIKAKGREYAKRGNVAIGIVITVGFFAYASYLLLRGGMQAASTIVILMILLGAYWYAIYSGDQKK